MKNLTLLTCASAAGLIGLVAAATAADNGSDTPRPHRFRHALMQRLTAVGVTDAQKEQIRGIAREFRPAMKPLRQQLVQERRALRKAIHSTPVNEAAIRAQSARVAQIEADVAVKRAYISERVQSILTPEQIAKLKEMAAKFDAKVDEQMNRADKKADGT